MTYPLEFSSLDAFTQGRLRRIHHLTSAKTALRILQSRHIWSQDPMGFANFSTNRSWTLSGAQHEACEISLSFEFVGPVTLVPMDFNPKSYGKNVLYHHVQDLHTQQKLGVTISIGISRLAAGTSCGLKCTGAVPSDGFSLRCFSDHNSHFLAKRVEAELLAMRTIRVPKDSSERSRLAQLFVPPHFGLRPPLA
jgi:hypothetical protein